MIQPNSNEEIILSSNNEITLLNNSNNNGEINLNGNDSNETTLPDNNIQSSDINEIDLENSITNTTNSFSPQTIAIPFVEQVFETWDDLSEQEMIGILHQNDLVGMRVIIKCNTYATKNRTLPETVEREICFYTAEGNLNATIQRRLLSAKFPNITIYPRDLQNLMQKYKVADRQENDASNLLRQLLTKKTEEPGWEVFWEINRETKSLDKVFWMSPEQVQPWMTYHDIILNDNTHKTNQFNMPRSLFTAVDNHFRTHLVAQALVNDETKETYKWLLTSTLQVINYTPRVFITDSDPGMNAAIDSQYSGCNTYATKNRTLPETVEREICFYTAEGNLNATIQRRLLSAKFPNITIYPRDLQNLMQKYKVADRQENDASNLLRQLLTKKTEEPGWEVFWEINRETKSLDKVFWMSPEQVQPWMTYHDIILNDNTHKTNQFNMPRSLFTAVDNHFRTHLVAQALVNDETKETYKWLLTSTLQVINYTPRVFITDSDPGMNAAIDSQYSGVL
ncbi:hypothetical protein Glove_511g1 [Diversispora epigaea]|uniref:MULE transposase domain-containing protein n=1 Tax=Diversispora epigaea TaxID=1348612 RepID=A0A397GFN7_9GLOM|nr:hypothetical protein Glove_511g1 [Diversispora epigaea]